MKKLMMLAAMLALVLVVAVPAIAQVTNTVSQEAESGNVNITGTATSSGDNSDQCVTPLQFGNTGSLLNGQAVLKYASTSGGIGLGGSTFEFSPSESATCTQQVQQSAAASG